MVPSCSRLFYSDEIRYLNIHTLRYTRYRGDMIETYKILHSIYNTTVSSCSPRCQFSATRGTISNQLSIIVDMIFENTLSLKELLTCGMACHHMLLTPSQLIASRLTLINSGVDKNQDVYCNYKCDIARTGNRSVSNKQLFRLKRCKIICSPGMLKYRSYTLFAIGPHMPTLSVISIKRML